MQRIRLASISENLRECKLSQNYFFVTKNLMKKVKDSFITPGIMGSDHCPIGLDIKAK